MKYLTRVAVEDASVIPEQSRFCCCSKTLWGDGAWMTKTGLFRGANKLILFINFEYKTKMFNFHLVGFERFQDFKILGYCLVPLDIKLGWKNVYQIWPIFAQASFTFTAPTPPPHQIITSDLLQYVAICDKLKELNCSFKFVGFHKRFILKVLEEDAFNQHPPSI